MQPDANNLVVGFKIDLNAVNPPKFRGSDLRTTLKQLRYVEAAGRLGSISQAAKELAISESSITSAIDAMELSLDYQLFLRTPARGIQPTPLGRQALTLIRNFLQEAHHFEADLGALGSEQSGLVQVACYVTAAPAILPPLLENLTENFPSISVKVMEGNMQSVLEFLDEGEVDLAFTYKRGLQKKHNFFPLFDAPPFALINRKDPLSNASSVTFVELSELPMVLLKLPWTHEYFSGLFERRGLKPQIAHTTRSAEIARALVAAGFGYTILNIKPPDYIQQKEHYRAVPIADVQEGQSFGIVTHTSVRPPRVVSTFIDSCLKLRDEDAFKTLSIWDKP